MARQMRIASMKAPRMAPTAMKTVPWGALECCMNGALLVGGIVGGGYVGIGLYLVKVGRPVRAPSSAMLLSVVWTGAVVAAADVFSSVEVGSSSSVDAGAADVGSALLVDLGVSLAAVLVGVSSFADDDWAAAADVLAGAAEDLSLLALDLAAGADVGSESAEELSSWAKTGFA